ACCAPTRADGPRGAAGPSARRPFPPHPRAAAEARTPGSPCDNRDHLRIPALGAGGNGVTVGLDEKLTFTHAGQPLPAPGTASVFLAGPTPRSADVPSWRPAVVREIAAQWRGPAPLSVFIPEPAGGQRWAYYDNQMAWETDARAAASAILFWIPRDLRTLP